MSQIAFMACALKPQDYIGIINRFVNSLVCSTDSVYGCLSAVHIWITHPIHSVLPGPQLGILSQYIFVTKNVNVDNYQADLKHTGSRYPKECEYFSACDIHFVNALAYLNIFVTNY